MNPLCSEEKPPGILAAMRTVSAWILPFVLLCAGVASAQDDVAEPASPPPTATRSEPGTPSPSQASSQPARVDPQGRTGISPYRQGIARGDAVFIAGDYPRADDEYREAITLSPSEPLGHLRLAELDLKQDRLGGAEEAAQAALRYAASHPDAQLRATMLLAQVQERQGKLHEARTTWSKYGQLAARTPAGHTGTARVGTATAQARLAAIARVEQLKAEYAAVRERMQQNVDAADDATGAGSNRPAAPAQ